MCIYLSKEKKKFNFTLAASDTRSQFPPMTMNFPLPIWARISSAESSELLANGLKLANKNKTLQRTIQRLGELQ